MSRRFGEWESPLSAADAARAGARFGGVHLGAGSVMWSESLPAEGGRMALWFCHLGADGNPDDRCQEFRPGRLISARSRINEYGGGAFWRDDSAPEPRTFWVDAETQCIHTAGFHGPLSVLTRWPPEVRTRRYAAGVIAEGGSWMFAERELHLDPDGNRLREPVNDLIAAKATGNEVLRLVGPDDTGGGDFVAGPKISPDGRTLAWLRWDHPDMPWDAAELWAATVDSDDGMPTLVNPRRVAGGHEDSRVAELGRAVSVCLPEWSPDGTLWWCDDADDWWHLRHASLDGLPPERDGECAERALPGDNEEIGEPRWVSGGCRYGFTRSGRIVFVASSGGLDGLFVFDPATGTRARVPGPEFTYVESISVCGDRVAAIAGTPTLPTSVWLIDLSVGSSDPSDSLSVDVGSATNLRGVEPLLAEDLVSRPEPISFGTDGGVDCQALLYRPTRPETSSEPAHLGAAGDAGDDTGPELPPLVVRIHGGPTASARSEFSTSVQFWTTRGIAVVDVNYRGSTGFGRKYRDMLRGEWGVADVRDCIAAARHLAHTGVVDGRRCVIRGGSSGGFTALAAICFQEEWGFADSLAAACSLYGVTDLAAMTRDTHKFESRYLDGLVGPYPEQAARYEARSPLYNAHKLTKPVLLLQGSEDRIVPQSQAEVLVDAMASNSVPHAYVLYEGEGHGFVNATTVERALETELAFYGVALGFEPAGDLPQVDLD